MCIYIAQILHIFNALDPLILVEDK